MKKQLKIYLLSYDTLLSLIVATLLYCFLPTCINTKLAMDLFGMGIGVLSITFSVLFASLAFIISSSDDSFVAFLEEDGGVFTEIVNTYTWTVGSLFIGLIYSIIVYSISAFKISIYDDQEINNLFIVIFGFLFFYGLIATLLSTTSAIKYTKRRIDYTKRQKDCNKKSD